MSDYQAETELGPWQGVQSTCPECGGRVLTLAHDGRCLDCAGVRDEQGYHERRARAIQGLYRATAAYMRRTGYPEEAAYWEHRGGK
jgi:hypothetical protein